MNMRRALLLLKVGKYSGSKEYGGHREVCRSNVSALSRRGDLAVLSVESVENTTVAPYRNAVNGDAA